MSNEKPKSNNPPHRPGLRFKLITALLIISVFFILLEYTVRKLYEPMRDLHLGGDPDIARLTYNILTGDPDFIWKLQSDLEVKHPRTGRIMHTNTLGYSGPDFEMEKSEGTTRVVCIGGSTLFGMGLADTDTLPVLLQKRLGGNSGKHKVEVINLAAPGYSSFQGLKQAELLFPTLQPDLVVMSFGLADAAVVNHTDEEVQASIPRSQMLFIKLNPYLGWSRLFQLIRNKFRSEESRSTLGRTTFTGGKGSRVTARVPPAAFRSNISAIIRLVRELGGRCILLDENLANYYAQGVIREVARKNRVPFFCMREILEKAAPQGTYQLKDPNKPKRIIAIQVSGIPEGPDKGSESTFLIQVPLGQVRHPPVDRLHLNDNGEHLDLVADDGIYTARIEVNGSWPFEFAPAKKMLIDQMGIYQLFINNNPFYRLPPLKHLEDKGLYYSPVLNFSKPSFDEYLLDFSTTLLNEKGARLMADTLLPTVRKLLASP